MEVEAAFYYYLHATEKKKKVNKTRKRAKQSVFKKCQKSGSSSTHDSLPLSEYVHIYICRYIKRPKLIDGVLNAIGIF